MRLDQNENSHHHPRKCTSQIQVLFCLCKDKRIWRGDCIKKAYCGFSTACGAIFISFNRNNWYCLLGFLLHCDCLLDKVTWV